MKKLVFFIILFNGISVAMQPAQLQRPLLSVFLAEEQFLCLDFNAKLTHVVQNKNIVTVLYLTHLEYTRTYVHKAENKYECVYAGRKLLEDASVPPKVVEQSFPKLIAEYGLIDKTIEQIKAMCIKHSNPHSN